MKDSNYIPDGTGVVMGDTKPMPDRGTGTGMTGYDPQLEGTDIGLDSINRMGSATGTDSDPMEQDKPKDPSVPAHKSLGGA